MNDVLLILAVAKVHAAYHRERLAGAQRRLFVLGNGQTDRARAERSLLDRAPETDARFHPRPQQP